MQNVFTNSNLVLPVPCQWGSWDFGPCSKSCGGGVRIKSRTKVIEERNGGNCLGSSTVSEPCNTISCPITNTKANSGGRFDDQSWGSGI